MSPSTCAHIRFSQGKDLCTLPLVAPDTDPRPRRGALIPCTFQNKHTETSAHPTAFPKRESLLQVGDTWRRQNLTVRVNCRPTCLEDKQVKQIHSYIQLLKRVGRWKKRKNCQQPSRRLVTEHSRSTMHPSPRWVLEDLPWLSACS